MLVSVTNLAIVSRLAIIGLQFAANLLIPDHEAHTFKAPLDSDHVPKPLDGLVNVVFGGFNRWDAQYFLHISEHGYTYENTLAFQPLFPFIVKVLASLLTNVTELWISYRELSLVIAIVLNFVFFIRAAHALYRLSNLVLGNKKRTEIAVALFCLNPASIFFSAPYSEGLFCWLSFLVMIQCLDDINSIFITIPLSLSVLCRSNGILNIGFYVYFSLKKIMVPYSVHNAICTCSKMFVIFMLIAFHYGMAQVYIYYLFCFEHKFNFPKHVLDYGLLKNYVMAGNKSEETSPWCSNRLPLSYSYVQSHYWDVGFLKYYELKQIPNFLLALPVIIIVMFNTYNYVVNNWDYTIRLGIFKLSKKQIKSMKNYDRLVLPFVLHAATMAIFSLFFVHIQITTRMLASSSPMLYWYAADYFTSDRTFIKNQVIQKLNKQMKNGGSAACNHVDGYIALNDIRNFDCMNYKQKLIIIFYIGYALIGTILFSNFLPWT